MDAFPLAAPIPFLDGAARAAWDLAMALAGGLLGALLAGLWLGLAPRRGAAARRPLRFRLEDGALVALSRAARRFPASGAARVAAAEAAARLTRIEGPADPAAAFAALEAEGVAFRLLAETPDGAAWEIRGAPEGGEARLCAAPAAADLREIARLRAALAAAEAERDAARELAERAPALIWRRGPDGRLLWANARHRALSAPPGADAAGAPSELSTAEGRAAESLHGRRAVFDARTGERLWFEISRVPAADGGALGYGLDAAPAVQAETALRRFADTFAETFAHLRIGLAIFGRDQRLALSNPAFAEMMRLDPAWLAGRPAFGEVLARLREARMAPEQADFADWRRSLAAMFEADAAGLRDDRTEIWQLPGEVTLRVVARPHPQGAAAFLFEDISEAARLERRWLAETETRRAVMDRLEEGLAAFGPDGQARFANPAFARIWGFRPGPDDEPLRLREALARFRAMTAPTPAWDRLAAFFEASGARAPWTELAQLADGRRLRARVAALPDGSVLTAFVDVTDAARAETALRERNAALEEAEEIRAALLEQLARRVRTPLNTLAGFGQMLRDGAGGPALSARQRGYADGILDAAAEIQDAMSGVADLVAAQAGAIALSAEAVDLAAALAVALDRVRRAADRRGVRLAADPRDAAEAVGAVAGDPARVRQILFNMLADAIHRSPPGAEVRAGARRCGARVEIWTDEPAPEGAEAAAAPGGRGGLAHALVRRFAELHGGEVRVETVTRGADEASGADDPGPRERPLPFAEVPAGAARVRVVCALPAAPAAADAAPAPEGPADAAQSGPSLG